MEIILSLLAIIGVGSVLWVLLATIKCILRWFDEYEVLRTKVMYLELAREEQLHKNPEYKNGPLY